MTTKVITVAIANLAETMTLFGSGHYFYKYLQARKEILESQLDPTSFPTFANANTVDKNRQDAQEFARKLALRRKESLLKGLGLEPNMISTYVLLSNAYRATRQPDSALYYQEKVVELLPNQGYVYYNLGMNYQSMKYADAQKRPAPHPKAIEYLEKAIAVEPALNDPYFVLADLYMSVYVDEANRNYAKAIPYTERLVAPFEANEQEFIKQGVTNLQEFKPGGKYDPYFANFVQLTVYWSKLYFLYKATGNPEKAVVYLDKLRQKAEQGQSVYGYLLVVSRMYDLLQWEEDETYLKVALDLQLKALQKAEHELTVASAEDKPLSALKYREQLKGISGTYRLLKNYSEAEHFSQRAIAYPVVESPILSRLKLVSSIGTYYKNTFILSPNPLRVQKKPNGDYGYSLDANLEMFFLRWDQNKPDEAFAWLEKSFQVSAAEHGNDVSGKPFEGSMFEAFKALDRERFLALKAKYFPPAEKK